eukprot:tig00001027_g6395.t1
MLVPSQVERRRCKGVQKFIQVERRRCKVRPAAERTGRGDADISFSDGFPVITSLPGRSEVHSGGEAALSGCEGVHEPIQVERRRCEVRPAAEQTGRGDAEISFSDGFPVIALLPGRSRAHSGGEAALSGCETASQSSHRYQGVHEPIQVERRRSAAARCARRRSGPGAGTQKSKARDDGFTIARAVL